MDLFWEWAWCCSINRTHLNPALRLGTTREFRHRPWLRRTDAVAKTTGSWCFAFQQQQQQPPPQRRPVSNSAPRPHRRYLRRRLPAAIIAQSGDCRACWTVTMWASTAGDSSVDISSNISVNSSCRGHPHSRTVPCKTFYANISWNSACMNISF